MGANGTATFFIKIHQMAHVSQKVGQACAMAMVLMALILLFTVLQRLFFRYVMKDSESTFNAKGCFSFLSSPLSDPAFGYQKSRLSVRDKRLDESWFICRAALL